jgi:signal recognition particle receptor subunit beta
MDTVYRKLVVIGNVGAGKSTIIKTLSEIEPVDTDVESSVDIGKELTTVGIDYGRITLAKDLAIGIYGVPGQKRYSFVWDMVKENMWACVLLLRSDEVPSDEELLELIQYFIDDKNETPLVVGVTHTDKQSFDMKVLQQFLSKHGYVAPVFTIDPREKEHSLLLLHTVASIREASKAR